MPVSGRSFVRQVEFDCSMDDLVWASVAVIGETIRSWVVWKRAISSIFRQRVSLRRVSLLRLGLTIYFRIQRNRCDWSWGFGGALWKA